MTFKQPPSLIHHLDLHKNSLKKNHQTFPKLKQLFCFVSITEIENMYRVSIEFYYKSTSVLSWMLFSDWLRYSLCILW